MLINKSGTGLSVVGAGVGLLQNGGVEMKGAGQKPKNK